MQEVAKLYSGDRRRALGGGCAKMDQLQLHLKETYALVKRWNIHNPITRHQE